MNKIEAWIITAGLLWVVLAIPARVYWLAVLVLVGLPAVVLLALLV